MSPGRSDNVLALVRGVLAMAAVMLLLFGAGLAADLVAAALPLRRLSSFNVNEARLLVNVFSRASNQLMAVVFTTVAIAVPLTANLYSLKFLEFFVKDRVNAAALTLVVFGDLNTTLLMYSLKDDFVPMALLHAQLGLQILSFSLLFPYLYYVFRFLHPNTLLQRLEAEIHGHLASACRRPAKAPAQRGPVAEAIEHVANIAIRSVDRVDRNTAIDAVLVLERVMRGYWRVKTALPPRWFEAEAQAFLAFSSKATEEMTESRSWVEMKVFSQLRLVLSASIPATHDVTSSVAKTLRRLGLEEPARKDPALRELVTEYFNTFLRLAINRRDTRSVFTLFDQYRTLAEALSAECPDLVLEVADYFEYYAQAARDAGLTFIVESVAHDLGALVRHAWEAGAPNARVLLEHFLRYHEQAGPVAGVKKAQAILASYFLLSGRLEPVEEIRRSFEGLEPGFLRELRDDLMGVRREKYWEVNERRMNMDYVPEPQRRHLAAFLEGLGS